jgi:hypothetical protein
VPSEPQNAAETREACRVKLAYAELELRRGLVALRLELPDPVWQDFNKRFAAYRDAAWDGHNRERAS